MTNIGFIGAGHIANAMARGWCRANREDAPALRYYDVAAGQAAKVAAATGGTACDSLAEVISGSDLVVVAVRPRDVDAVLADVGPLLGDRGLVSVAAGVTLERLRAALPDGAKVGRVMPNTAAELGLGVFLFVPGTLGDRAADAERVLGLMGAVVELDESLFDVATAVSGCMPGFMAAFVEAFAKAGRRGGLDDDTARRLSVAAAHGAAALVEEVGDYTSVMIATATPGGMTAAGLAQLRDGHLAAAVEAAVEAATARAKELA